MTAGTVVPCPGTASNHGTVAVSMPYWRTPSTVRAAVEAVLAQTYTDLLLYVVNDGDGDTPPWPALSDLDDPRLVRVDLTPNRGRYFCDAAVLAATRAPWLAIHDADDLAAPHWLRTLITAAAAHGWVAAFAPQWVVDEHGTAHLESVARPLVHGGRMRYLAHHAGLYRTGSLREAGGIHPGYRVAFDTLLVNLMSMTGPIGAVDRPLYARTVRPGSLMTSAETGRGSVARRAARRRLDLLYHQARTRGAATAMHGDIPAELVAEVAAAATLITYRTPGGQ